MAVDRWDSIEVQNPSYLAACSGWQLLFLQDSFKKKRVYPLIFLCSIKLKIIFYPILRWRAALTIINPHSTAPYR